MALAMPVSQPPAGLPPEDPHLSHCSQSQLRVQPVVCLPGLAQFNMWPLPWLSSSVGNPRAVCAVASDGRRQRPGVHGIPQPPHTSWDLSTSETQSFGGRVCPRFSGMVLGSHRGRGMGWWQAEQEEPVPVHCERSLSMMQEKEEPPPLSPDGMGGGRQEARWQDPKFQPDWPLGSFPGVWVDGLRAPDTLRSWLSQHCAGRDCSGSNPFTGFSVQYPIHCTHTPNLPWGSLVPAWPASWNSAQTNTFGDSLQGFKERLPTASKEDVPAPPDPAVDAGGQPRPPTR